MLEILFLLLPLAFYSGWRSGRKTPKKKKSPEGGPVPKRFILGINFLLNEEPDKALDVLIETPVIDNQTADTFLALGKLFRGRGEVNRALRIHQNLIARPNLSAQQRRAAVLALGDDFFAAGMLDRAERVLNEMLAQYPDDIQAQQTLRHIYEQLSEWEKAIQLLQVSEKNTENQCLIAHYLCEQASVLLKQNQLYQVDEKLSKALKVYPESARVQAMLAELALAREDKEAALKYFSQAIHRDQRLMGSLLERLRSVFTRSGQLDRLFQEVLSDYVEKKDPQLFAALLKLAQDSGEDEVTTSHVYAYLQEGDLTLQNILQACEFLAHQDTLPAEDFASLGQALQRLNQLQPRFQCTHCGYRLHDYLWRCPACHRWDSIQLA